MCGLVGLAGDCSLKMRDVFADLLYVDTLRGAHSTGAAFVTRLESDIHVEKLPVAGPEFLRSPEFKKLNDVNMLKTMIGHNRYATIGEKTAKNAHPFAFENTVGAHNGTIDKFALKELEDSDKFGTDSEAIYNSIEKYGLKATIGKLTGAWALTFFDKKNNTINLIRNNKRPLYYVYTEDLETILWASEAEMLAWVLARHNIKVKDNRIHECEPDVHYRWTLPVKWQDKFDKPTIAKVEGYKFTYKAPAVVYRNNSGYNEYNMYADDEQFSYHYGHGNANTHTNHVPKTNYKAQFDKAKAKKSVEKFRPPYKDHHNRVINKVNFDKLVVEGCVYCDDNSMKWGDFIHPLKDDMDGRKIFLCKECYLDETIKELVEGAI